VEDEPRSGRPASARTNTNLDRVRAFIRRDRRLTTRMIADELNINDVPSTNPSKRYTGTRETCVQRWFQEI
jgi:hypothetical protein